MNEPPIDGEEEVDYMRRCMKSFGDQDIDNEEKASICLASFRGDSKGSKDILSRIDFHLCCSKYLTEVEIGYEEELTEANFYIPEVSEYEDFGEETEEVSTSSLWENIRNKKKKLGKNYKPAKPGDKDRPDPKSWKKAQSGEGEMAKDQIKKMHNQLMQIVAKMEAMDVELEEWTTDMVSKAEIYIQNIFDFVESYTGEDESYASEYQGRTVTLNKPFRTPKGPKKFSVYTKNEKGNVVKVNFGDPMSSIKRDDPARRKSFRARHNCDNAGPKWQAKFWSCRQWRANSPVEAKGDK
jgi:hypothetical protein